MHIVSLLTHRFRWAGTESRARMLASVFAMQPLGQLCAAAAGWIALVIADSKFGLRSLLESDQTQDDARAVVDRIWRGVVGFGAIPGVIAIGFRFFLPDPGRYTLEVQDDIDRAVDDTERVQKRHWWHFWRSPLSSGQIEMQILAPSHRRTDHTDETRSSEMSQLRDPRRSWSDAWNYLWHEKNGVFLIGTSGCWFLLDVAFYGLGINSIYTLSIVWADKPAENTGKTINAWNSNPTEPDNTIYDVLYDNAKKLILTSALGSLAGSILLLFVINRIGRKKLLEYSFLLLAFLLLATALCLRYFFGTSKWGVTLFFYILCQVLFNFGKYSFGESWPVSLITQLSGPNTLTFLIPAEIFPTRYRCLFHGISAAAGKLGSVIVQLILKSIIHKDNDAKVFNHQAHRLSWVLIGFFFVMAAGWPLAHICIPNLQKRGSDGKLVSKSLEDLAKGIPAVERDGQVLGIDWIKCHWPVSLFRSPRAEKTSQNASRIRPAELPVISEEDDQTPRP
jgi:PHS family inorganic phosphate transporter-like MFS transporter